MAAMASTAPPAMIHSAGRADDADSAVVIIAMMVSKMIRFRVFRGLMPVHARA
jgi:hypothetical protein